MVGAAILHFGEIELFTYFCLKHTGNPGLDQGFTKRANRVIELLGHERLPQNEAKAVISILEKAKALAEYRNVLAHNPLQIRVYEHLVTGDLYTEPSISDARSREKVIDLENLKELVGELEGLTSDLYMKFGRVITALEEVEERRDT